MNRADLIQTVSKKCASDFASKAAAERVVDSVIDSIAEALKAGQDVTLRNFGTFKVKQTAERQGRNMATGEAITIPAHRTVRFTAGTGLKQAIH